MNKTDWIIRMNQTKTTDSEMRSFSGSHFDFKIQNRGLVYCSQHEAILDFQQYQLNVRKHSRPDLGSDWTFENEQQFLNEPRS